MIRRFLILIVCLFPASKSYSESLWDLILLPGYPTLAQTVRLEHEFAFPMLLMLCSNFYEFEDRDPQKQLIGSRLYEAGVEMNKMIQKRSNYDRTSHEYWVTEYIKELNRVKSDPTIFETLATICDVH
jgi:hypothetical protein